MKTHDINELLDYFQDENKSFSFDENAIAEAYQDDNKNQSLAVKVISSFGGILASLAFFGFLLVSGIYDSGLGMSVLGGILIIGSVAINKAGNSTLLDTASVSFFLAGFLLFGMGISTLHTNEENLICGSFIIISLCTLMLAPSYIFSFFSVLILNGSILTLIISNEHYNSVHIYVSLLAFVVTYLFLHEAKIITTHKTLAKLYKPVKIGLIFSFLAGLTILGTKAFPLSPNYIWVSSVVNIALIAYLVFQFSKILNIQETKAKIGVCIFTVLILSPTALSPAISGALLVLLLSFYANYKTGFVLGIIAFIYFVSQYYYDLKFTLLTKSAMLFATGVLFIALYLFTAKKLTSNEKI